MKLVAFGIIRVTMSRGHVNKNPFIQIVVIFFFDS